MKKQTAKMQAVREGLNARFHDRRALIDGMLTALIARENLFMFGLPGTGKSALTETLCQAIEGGKHFGYVISKFTTPEELFGPVSLSALQNDSYERVITGRLPEATVAFLDEVYKGSSAILNTLLPVMNERKFNNGTKALSLPLEVLFAASNEIPDSEELAAFHDRFALKFVTERLGDDALARHLFVKPQLSAMPTITTAEIHAEQTAAASLSLSDEVVDALIAIRADIHAEGIYVSDRKWVQSVKVVRAFARLNEHEQVELDDLDILEHMLWSSPDSRRTIQKIIAKHSNPVGEKLAKIQDAVAEIQQDFDEMTTSEAAEVVQKIKKLSTSLLELGDPQKNKKLAKALADTDTLFKNVLEKKLGLKLGK